MSFTEIIKIRARHWWLTWGRLIVALLGTLAAFLAGYGVHKYWFCP